MEHNDNIRGDCAVIQKAVKTHVVKLFSFHMPSHSTSLMNESFDIWRNTMISFPGKR